MKILIGYHQRSGSTLLQHILNAHSHLRSFSDANSLLVLPALLAGYKPVENVVVKPMDTYLSALEVGYAYGTSLYLPGKKLYGIDVGLLKRWKRVYQQFFSSRSRWHLIRYEDLVTDPDPVLKDLFEYLELPYERVYPFERFNLAAGGDPKLSKTNTIHRNSVQRYKQKLNALQIRVFKKFLGKEMKALGYL